MKNYKFNKYKKIRTLLESQQYKGVALDKLCAFNIANFVYHFSERSFVGKVKSLIRALFLIPALKKRSSYKDSLFGWSIQRPDYTKLADAYKRKLGWEFDDICLSYAGNGVGMRFDWSALTFSWKKAKYFTALSLYEKLIIFLSLYNALNFFNFLEHNFDTSNLKNYLSFNSSFDYENIFTLFLRSRGVTTFSMQHGMYFEFKNEIPFEMITSYYCSAENFLLWGEFSKEQIKGFLPRDVNCVLFGNPLYENFNQNSFDRKSNFILVGLPRKTYQNEIESLINILKLRAFKGFFFKLRLHPNIDKNKITDLISEYENFSISEEPTLAEDLVNNKYLAFIGFNSTVLFEATLYSLPVLQYISGNDEFITVGFQEFKTANVLLVKIKHLTENSNKVNGFQKYFE